MDFYIPKYKELYVKDGHMGLGVKVSGEYRAILIGEDDRLKSDTGWKPNTLLNRGLNIMSSTGAFERMWLGNSDIAVDVTQSGIQGAQVGTYEYLGSPSYAVNQGLPDYERVTIEQSKWAPGEATGTIKEFAITQSGGTNPTTQGCVRVVLTDPIVKGSGDELTILHRFTWYPQLGDTTGVISISGIDYNWTMRHTNIGAHPSGHPVQGHYVNAGSYGFLKDGELDVATAGSSLGNICGYPGITSSVTFGGSLPTYWAERTYTCRVDDANYWNGLIRSWYNDMLGPSGACGIQMRWGKVSDDSPLQKLNTHVLTYGCRISISRHTP